MPDDTSSPRSHADEQRRFPPDLNYAHFYASVGEQWIRSQIRPLTVPDANYFPSRSRWATPHFQPAGADEPPFFNASGGRSFTIVPSLNSQPLERHGLDPHPWASCSEPPLPPLEEERQARRRIQNREAQRRLRERVRERELQAEASARATAAGKSPDAALSG